MDARGLMNFQLGETPFDPISKITYSNDGYICASGDSFVQSSVEIDCDIVDMEAYAIAKACYLESVPFACFKFVSDFADKSSANDFNQNVLKAGEVFSNYLSRQLV